MIALSSHSRNYAVIVKRIIVTAGYIVTRIVVGQYTTLQLGIIVHSAICIPHVGNYTHIHTYTHAHTRTNTHTHAHTHTHTHTATTGTMICILGKHSLIELDVIFANKMKALPCLMTDECGVWLIAWQVVTLPDNLLIRLTMIICCLQISSKAYSK